MGIDIEMYAEVRDSTRWRPAGPLVENEGYDPEIDPSEPRLRPQSLFCYRNRKLFAILTETISPHRGLPEDISPEVLAIERPRHDDGLFGHSWLSLEELTAFDWKNPIVQMEGMVIPEAVPLFEGNPLGFPYKGWPEGKSVGYSNWPGDGVNVRWRETYEMIAGPEFMGEILPKLRSFGPPASVRIVFWFDY